MSSRRTAIALGLLAAIPLPLAAQGWTSMGPSARGGHGMAYDSGRGCVVVFGGFDANGFLVNDTWELSGSTWVDRGSGPPGLTPRWRHSMAYDAARQRVVVVGGHHYGGWYGTTPGTWEWDGSRWTAEADDPGPDYWDNALAYDSARARMVLWSRDRTWEYAGAGWQPGAATPAAMTPRSAAGMAYDDVRARTILFGGRCYQGGPKAMCADTWEYDGASWTLGAAAPAGLTGRRDHALGNLGGGRIVLFGGYDGDQYHADTWTYDGSGWSAGPAAPPDLVRRQRAAMVTVGPGQLLLHGGEYSRLFFDDLWKFDGSTWGRGAPPAPTARWNHALTVDSVRGRAIVFGGEGPSLFGSTYEGPRRGDVWEHDGVSWRPGVTAPAGIARTRHAMVYDAARARVVVFGGSGPGGNVRNDTWYYDGTAWNPGPAPPPALVPRASHAMAFDAVRARTVLYGGRSATGLLDDTWELDATVWSAGPSAPPLLTPRTGHAMAFDTLRGRTVLVGGDDGMTRLDVWERAGGGWSSGLTPPSDFLPRADHAAAFDEARGCLVVFGGRSTTPTDEVVIADTWEYRGSSWTHALALPPDTAGRMDTAMAFHGGLGRMLLFGGREEVSVFGDTWFHDAREALGYVAGRPLAAGSGSEVAGFSLWGTPAAAFHAYGAPSWGVNVSSGFVAPGTRDVVLTGPGPGPSLGPHVRAFAPGGAPVAGISFYAYGTLRYGVNVASGRIDGDAFHEILTGPGPGTPFGPQVRGWDHDGGPLASIPKVNFFAYGTLRYGVAVAGADVDGDLHGEILTAPGPSPAFSPQVRGFDYDDVAVSAIPAINFDAFTIPQYGALVAGGDVDGDLLAEIVAAHGPGPALPPRYLGFDLGPGGVSPLPLYDTVWGAGTYYGGRIALGDIQPDGLAELVGGSGRDPGAATTVKTWVYSGSHLSQSWIYFDAFPGSSYGVNVATAYAGY